MSERRSFRTLYDTINESSGNSRSVIELLLNSARGEGNNYKQFTRTWPTTDVLQLLDVNMRQLSDVLKEQGIKPEKVNGRYEYSIDQIYQIRKHLNLFDEVKTLPIVSVMSGKGGVSKTTFTVHLAQKMVIEGKRVLLIDTDPQASATTMVLGVNPDIVFDADDTVAGFMMEREIGIDNLIIQSNMTGLDIIPCCQSASIMDLEGMQAGTNNDQDVADRFWSLKDTLEYFRSDYDVVLIDTPPTVTFTNIRCAIASNIIICPIAPSLTDIASSTGYENTLRDYLEDLVAVDATKPQALFARRFVISQYDHRLQAHRGYAELIREIYPSTYMTPFANLTEVANTNKNGTTIYEERSAINSGSTRRKALTVLDSLFDEVIDDIDELSQTMKFEAQLETVHG